MKKSNSITTEITVGKGQRLENLAILERNAMKIQKRSVVSNLIKKLDSLPSLNTKNVSTYFQLISSELPSYASPHKSGPSTINHSVSRNNRRSINGTLSTEHTVKKEDEKSRGRTIDQAPIHNSVDHSFEQILQGKNFEVEKYHSCTGSQKKSARANLSTMKHSLLEINRLSKKTKASKDQEAGQEQKVTNHLIKVDNQKRKETLQGQLDALTNVFTPRREQLADSRFLINLCTSLKNSGEKVSESTTALPGKLHQAKNYATKGRKLSQPNCPQIAVLQAQYNSNPCLQNYPSPLKSQRRLQYHQLKASAAGLIGSVSSRNRTSCCILPISELPECIQVADEEILAPPPQKLLSLSPDQGLPRCQSLETLQQWGQIKECLANPLKSRQSVHQLKGPLLTLNQINSRLIKLMRCNSDKVSFQKQIEEDNSKLDNNYLTTSITQMTDNNYSMAKVREQEDPALMIYENSDVDNSQLKDSNANILVTIESSSALAPKGFGHTISKKNLKLHQVQQSRNDEQAVIHASPQLQNQQNKGPFQNKIKKLPLVSKQGTSLKSSLAQRAALNQNKTTKLSLASLSTNKQSLHNSMVIKSPDLDPGRGENKSSQQPIFSLPMERTGVKMNGRASLISKTGLSSLAKSPQATEAAHVLASQGSQISMPELDPTEFSKYVSEQNNKLLLPNLPGVSQNHSQQQAIPQGSYNFQVTSGNQQSIWLNSSDRKLSPTGNYQAANQGSLIQHVKQMAEFMVMKENPVLRIAKQIQRNASQDKLHFKDQVATKPEKRNHNHHFRGLSQDNAVEERQPKPNVKGLSVLHLGPLNTSKSKERKRQNVASTEHQHTHEKDGLAVENARNSSMVAHSFKKSNKIHLAPADGLRPQEALSIERAPAKGAKNQVSFQPITLNQVKALRKQQYGSVQLASEGKEKESPAPKLTAEGIAANRSRVVNSELGQYLPAADMSSLKTDEDPYPEPAKKLLHQSSARELEQRALKLAANRQKNSSMIHIDGNKLQLLNQKLDNSASQREASHDLSNPEQQPRANQQSGKRQHLPSLNLNQSTVFDKPQSTSPMGVSKILHGSRNDIAQSSLPQVVQILKQQFGPAGESRAAQGLASQALGLKHVSRSQNNANGKFLTKSSQLSPSHHLLTSQHVGNAGGPESSSTRNDYHSSFQHPQQQKKNAAQRKPTLTKSSNYRSNQLMSQATAKAIKDQIKPEHADFLLSLVKAKGIAESGRYGAGGKAVGTQSSLTIPEAAGCDGESLRSESQTGTPATPMQAVQTNRGLVTLKVSRRHDENDAEGRRASDASRQQQLDRLKITLKTKPMEVKGVHANARVLQKSEMYTQDSKDQSIQQQLEQTKKDALVGTTLTSGEGVDVDSTRELATLLFDEMLAAPLDAKGDESPRAPQEKTAGRPAPFVHDLVVKMPGQPGLQLDSPIRIQSMHPERGGRLSPKFKKPAENTTGKTTEKQLQPQAWKLAPRKQFDVHLVVPAQATDSGLAESLSQPKIGIQQSRPKPDKSPPGSLPGLHKYDIGPAGQLRGTLKGSKLVGVDMTRFDETTAGISPPHHQGSVTTSHALVARNQTVLVHKVPGPRAVQHKGPEPAHLQEALQVQNGSNHNQHLLPLNEVARKKGIQPKQTASNMSAGPKGRGTQQNQQRQANPSNASSGGTRLSTLELYVTSKSPNKQRLHARGPHAPRSPRLGDYEEPASGPVPRPLPTRSPPQATGEAVVKTQFDYAIYNMNEQIESHSEVGTEHAPTGQQSPLSGSLKISQGPAQAYFRRGASQKRLPTEGKTSPMEPNPSGSQQLRLQDSLGQSVSQTVDALSEKSREKETQLVQEAPSPTSGGSPRRKKRKIHLKKSNRGRVSPRRSKKELLGLSAERCPLEPRIAKGGAMAAKLAQAVAGSKRSHGQYQSTLQNSQSSGQNSSMLSSDREDERGEEVEVPEADLQQPEGPPAEPQQEARRPNSKNNEYSASSLRDKQRQRASVIVNCGKTIDLQGKQRVQRSEMGPRMQLEKVGLESNEYGIMGDTRSNKLNTVGEELPSTNGIATSGAADTPKQKPEGHSLAAKLVGTQASKQFKTPRSNFSARILANTGGQAKSGTSSVIYAVDLEEYTRTADKLLDVNASAHGANSSLGMVGLTPGQHGHNSGFSFYKLDDSIIAPPVGGSKATKPLGAVIAQAAGQHSSAGCYSFNGQFKFTEDLQIHTDGEDPKSPSAASGTRRQLDNSDRAIDAFIDQIDLDRKDGQNADIAHLQGSNEMTIHNISNYLNVRRQDSLQLFPNFKHEFPCNHVASHYTNPIVASKNWKESGHGPSLEFFKF